MGRATAYEGFEYDALRDRYFRRGSGLLQSRFNKEQKTVISESSNNPNQVESACEPLIQKIYALPRLQHRLNATALRTIVKKTSFNCLNSFSLRRYPSRPNFFQTFLPDGQCKFHCQIQKHNSNSYAQLLGCSSSALSVSTFDFHKASTPIRHVLWQPSDPLCGTVRSSCSPNGEVVVGVVSTGLYGSHALILKTNDIVDHPVNTGFGAADEVCITNEGCLFLAGKGLGSFNIQDQQMNWTAEMTGLPDIRCLSVSLTSNDIVTGHRCGCVTLWDPRQKRNRETATVCSKNLALEQVFLSLRNSDLFVGQIDGHVSRYDTRCNLTKGPYQTFGSYSTQFTGTQLFGQFCLNEDFGILAAIQKENLLSVYDFSSSKLLHKTFCLPSSKTFFPDQWCRPFFIPSWFNSYIRQDSNCISRKINTRCNEKSNYSLRSRIMSLINDVSSLSTEFKIMSVSDFGAILVRTPPSHTLTELYDWTFDGCFFNSSLFLPVGCHQKIRDNQACVVSVVSGLY